MDPQSVKQIVNAITSLHDGRTWKPETVFTGIAALAAAAAALATYRQGKAQIVAAHKELITSMREEWIRELRRKVSSHVSTCLERAHDPFVPLDEAMNRAREVLRQLVAMRVDILLMLNPKEQDHTDLGSALSKLEDVARRVPVNSSLLAEAKNEVLGVARRILKTEWDRTSSSWR